MSTGAPESQKSASDPLNLELKAIVSRLIQVLGNERGSSGRAEQSSLNH